MQQHYHTQPMVVLAQPPPVDNKLKPRSASALSGLSITQIVMGVFCVVMGTVLLPIEAQVDDVGSGIAFLGYGVWIGLLFVALGIIGLAASKTKRVGLITGALVLNIIYPATICIVLASLSSIGLILTSENNCHEVSRTYKEWEDQGYYWNSRTGIYEYSRGQYETRTTYETVCNKQGLSDVYWAFDSLMLVMALVEFVITIISSAICCGAVCRCCKQQVGSTVQYYSSPQQVFVQPASYPSVPNNYSYGYAFNSSVGIQQQAFYPTAQMTSGWSTTQPAPVQNIQRYPPQFTTQHNTTPPQQFTTSQPAAPRQPPVHETPQEEPTAPPPLSNDHHSNLNRSPARRNALPPIRNISLTGHQQPEPPRYSSLN